MQLGNCTYGLEVNSCADVFDFPKMPLFRSHVYFFFWDLTSCRWTPMTTLALWVPLTPIINSNECSFLLNYERMMYYSVMTHAARKKKFRPGLLYYNTFPFIAHMILFLLSKLFLPHNVFFGGLNHTSRQVHGSRLTVGNRPQTGKNTFQL